jgi:hypothetical protein
MQSYDENNRIIGSQLLEELNVVKAELQKPEVKHVVVGKFPNKGDVLIINGLQWVVKGIERKTGAMQLRILEP